MPTWKWVIPKNINLNQRIDQLITIAVNCNWGKWTLSDSEAPTLSRSQIQRLIKDHQIMLENSPVKSNSKPKTGQTITLKFLAPKPINTSPENIPIEILFEDKDLAVINKPSGLTVHPSTTQKENTLVNALLFHIKDLSGIGGNLRPGIVHRLDKFTSGVMVITKNDKAHINLSETFSKHNIVRKYLALCYCSLENSNKKIINTLIARNPKDRKKMSVSDNKGKRAITEVKLIEEYGLPKKKPFASLIEAQLQTGRTHQVRVHLTNLGCSLLGDPTYGKPTSKQNKWKNLPLDIQKIVKALPGQSLHAKVLGFKHPRTKKELYFEAPPPLHLQNLLNALKIYK